MENSELPTGVSSVFKKIHACMKNLSFIEKDKKNTFHNYMYASEEAIKKAVHAELVANGLVFTVTMEECIQTETTNQKGNKTYITNVKVNYCFTDIDTGDKLCGIFYGTGEDAMDKGTYKALTGAIKYILTTTFLIATGDDPENDKKEDDKKDDKKEQPKTQSKAEPKTSTGKLVLTKEIASNYEAAILNGEIGAYEEVFEKFVVGAAGKKMMDEAKKKYQELSGELTQ